MYVGLEENKKYKYLKMICEGLDFVFISPFLKLGKMRIMPLYKEKVIQYYHIPKYESLMEPYFSTLDYGFCYHVSYHKEEEDKFLFTGCCDSIKSEFPLDKRIIIIPLTIIDICKNDINIEQDQIIINESNQYHSGLVVIDNKKKQIERFEPRGSSEKELIHCIDDRVKLFLETVNPKFKQYKYYSYKDFFSGDGPQTIEKNSSLRDLNNVTGGFCGWWSIYYLQKRIESLDTLDRKDIMNNICCLSSDDAFNLIFNFRKQLLEKLTFSID